jgi:hypothetical protein
MGTHQHHSLGFGRWNVLRAVVGFDPVHQDYGALDLHGISGPTFNDNPGSPFNGPNDVTIDDKGLTLVHLV